MSKLIGIAALLASSVLVLGFFAVPVFGAGPGTIEQLQQFTSTSSPSSAITQTVFGKAIKITGLATGDCLTLNASSILTTTSCGVGGGGITTLGPVGQGQTGSTQTLATSSATTISGLTVGLRIVGNSNTQTFTPTFTGSISGLTTAAFSSANISQWTNNSNYIALTALSATSPIFYNNTTGVISSQAASGSQHGYLTSTDWSTFNGKQAAGNYITALTGDVTASGPGSVAGTLATVNSNVGSFTNANITVNAKGLITAASNGSGGSSTFGTTSLSAASPLSYSSALAQFSIPKATRAVDGYLASSDFQIFDNKISSTSLSVTTTGTSGAATYNSATGVFNIPQYTGGTGIAAYDAWTHPTAGVSATTSTITISNLLGVGSTSPFAKFSIHANNGDTNTTLLAVASSTQGATTTLFSINNLGTQNVNLDTSTTTIISLGGHQLLTASNSRQNVSLGVDTFTTDGSTQNVAIGYQTLQLGTNNGGNVAIGYQVARSMQFGGSNTMIGSQVAPNATNASNNVGIGFQSLFSFSSGATNNVAIGYQALNKVTNTSNSTAIGYSALFNATGDTNFGLGYQAGSSITTGFSNIILGNSVAASNLTTGGGTIGIGNNLFFPSASANNQINIGNFLYGTLPATSTVFKLPLSGAIGVGTSSPFAKFAIQSNNGDTATTLFAIGSSTSNSTTTLFSVSNIGSTTLGLFGACNTTNALTTDAAGVITCGAITGGGGGGTVTTALQGQNAFYNANGTTVIGTSTIFTAQNTFVGVASTSPFAKFSIQAVPGTNSPLTLFAIGSSTQSATTTLLSVSNVGALTTAGNILTSPAGSTLTNPRLVGFAPDFAFGEAARYQIGADAIGLQSGFNQRLTAYTYWAMEIRGGRQGIAAPAFDAGAATDPSLIVFGSFLNANNIMHLVSNDGSVTYDAFNKVGYLGIGSSTPNTSNLLVQNNFGSITSTLFTVASSTNSTGTTASTLFSISNAGAIITNYATGILHSVAGAITSSLVSLTADVTGTLPAANGGTGATSLSSGFNVVSNVLSSVEHHSFTYATSTAWTGTTTIPLEVGYGETWNNMRCFTDVGTLGVDAYHASSHLDFVKAASTTIGINTFATNNVMTSGDTIKVDIGNPASSPTKITCTVQDTI